MVQQRCGLLNLKKEICLTKYVEDPTTSQLNNMIMCYTIYFHTKIQIILG